MAKGNDNHSTVFEPFALRFHAHVLQRLHDPNWTGLDLYDHLKGFMRKRDPKPLFYQTVADGLLFEINALAYGSYFDPNRIEADFDVESAVWFAQDLVDLYRHHRITARSFRSSLGTLVRQGDARFERGDEAYDQWLKLRAVSVFDLLEDTLYEHEDQLLELRSLYATNLAERMFHDRALCKFVNDRTFSLGIDGGIDDNEVPTQWVPRKPIPNWAKEAVAARDRGLCALCSTPISMELLADPHIDHMLPLRLGGTNDLSNFQLLCDRCNRKKAASVADTRSSVPQYLQKGKLLQDRQAVRRRSRERRLPLHPLTPHRRTLGRAVERTAAPRRITSQRGRCGAAPKYNSSRAG